MNRRFIIPIISLLCMLLFAACSGKKKDVVAEEQAAELSVSNEYLKVLPADAMAIMKLDFGNLLEKSEILDNLFVKAGIEKEIMELPADQRSLIKRICDNPDNSGVNVNAPVYIAVVNMEPGRIVFAMAMDDVETFEETLSTISDGEFSYTMRDGMKHIDTGDSEVAVAYDSDKIIVVFDERYASVASYIELDEDEMALNKEMYASVFESDDDVMSACDVELCGRELVECGEVEPDFEPFFAMLQGCALYWSNDFENGYLASKANLTLPAELRDAIDSLVTKSSRRHFKYIPAKSFAVMSYNFNMTHLYPALQSMGVLAELNANGISNSLVKDILKAVSGDYTVACWVNGRDIEDVQLMAAVDCNDRSIFDLLAAYIVYEFDARKVDTDVYALNINNKEEYNYYTGEYDRVTRASDYYIMYKDGALMLMPENLYNELAKSGEFQSLGNSIMENSLFASMDNDLVVDFKPICDVLAVEIRNSYYASEDSRIALELLEMIKNLTANFNIYNFDAKLNLNDSSVNSLKCLTDKIVSLVVQENIF